MTRIGYNINLSAINNQAMHDAIASNADMHLLMTDSVNQIADWKQQLGANRIIWREYSDLEGDWSVYPTNQEIIGKWIKQGHRDIIRDDPCNEPSLDANNVELNKRYVERSVDLLRHASRANIKVAIGAFSVGTPHEDMIDSGIYDDLIRAVVNGGHYFSVHEYCPGIPGAGDVFGYDKLLHPETVLNRMPLRGWRIGEDYWLLRRSDRFVTRARELGLNDPQIVVTEGFIDLIPDANDVLNQLRGRYGIQRYNYDMRGVLSWRNYYAEAFDNVTFEDAVKTLTDYIARYVYNVDWIKGVCLFALNSLWDTPQGHNFLNPSLNNFRILGLPHINNNMPDSKKDNEPMADFGDMKEVLIHTNRTWNIRSDWRDYATSDNVIGQLPTMPTYAQISTNTVYDDGYYWHKIITEDLEGYFADQDHISKTPYNESEPLPDNTNNAEQQYYFDYGGGTIVISNLARLQWIENIKADIERNQRLLMRLENAELAE